MAIITRSRQGKMEIILSGPQGNPMHLCAVGRDLTRQLHPEDWRERWEIIQKDMLSGDYEHVLEVFNEHFGDYVDLVDDREPRSTDDDE